jgi:hypothetical protein
MRARPRCFKLAAGDEPPLMTSKTRQDDNAITKGAIGPVSVADEEMSGRSGLAHLAARYSLDWSNDTPLSGDYAV